jgi:indolepyruvate decarboxylase
VTAVLEDCFTALRQIDRTLQAARIHCKPVYIELPRDQVDVAGYPIPYDPLTLPSSDPGALGEAVAEAIEHLGKAASPVLLAGVEVHRRNLQDALLNLIERAQLPVAAILTGKSVVGEHHPAYLGIYEGAMGLEVTRQRVEEADLLLLLGVTLNDVDLGIFTARLDPDHMVHASQDEVVIRHHRYSQVYLQDFVPALVAALPASQRQSPQPVQWPQPEPFPEPGRPMSVARLIERLNTFLSPDMMVISDTGDCLFAAMDLRVYERTRFLPRLFIPKKIKE